MSEILGLFLEFVINLVVYVLEALADIWLDDFTWSGSRCYPHVAMRSPHVIFWCAIIVVLGVMIWWEFR